MNAIRPGIRAHVIELAKDQPQYTPLPVAMVTHPGYAPVRLRKDDDTTLMFNTMLSCWQPSPQERVQLAAGEVLYVGLLTQGSPMQPINIVVGARAAAEVYGVLRLSPNTKPPRTLVVRCPKDPSANIVEGHDMSWRCATCGRVLTTETVE